MQGSALRPWAPDVVCEEHAECGSTLPSFGRRTHCHGVAFGRQQGGERAGLRLGAAAIQFEEPLPNFVGRRVNGEIEEE